LRLCFGIRLSCKSGSKRQAKLAAALQRLVRISIMDGSRVNETAAVIPSPPYTLVATDADFRGMLEHVASVSRLAIDIEADSLYHYYEKVCLIQISTDSETFILDPLAINNVKDLAPIISNCEVEKVFHAAGYDIRCLRRDYGFSFTNIFDTHIAGQLLGFEFLGLSALMEKVLGIHHSKRMQRDDWSQRPLAAEQLDYAATDTHYLLPLRDALEKSLQEKGRLQWAREEFNCAASAEIIEKEFDPEGFRRIKGNRQLSPQHTPVLRALYLLRDMMARKLNVPPFKVLNNSVLMSLTLQPPKSSAELLKRPGISYRVARKFSNEILLAIAAAQNEDIALSEVPVRNNYKPPSRETKLRLEALKKWRTVKARELELHVGVVFPAGLLENLAYSPPEDLQAFARLPGMRQWRISAFGEQILSVLREQKSQPNPPAPDQGV
jgi:ribonuclease D